MENNPSIKSAFLAGVFFSLFLKLCFYFPDMLAFLIVPTAVLAISTIERTTNFCYLMWLARRWAQYDFETAIYNREKVDGNYA